MVELWGKIVRGKLTDKIVTPPVTSVNEVFAQMNSFINTFTDRLAKKLKMKHGR